MYRAPKRATQKKGGLRHEQVPLYRCVWIDYCYRFSFIFAEYGNEGKTTVRKKYMDDFEPEFEDALRY